MKTLHLFAGAGGSHLAGFLLGWQAIGSVEWDPWRAAFIRERFSDQPWHDDVSTYPSLKFGRPDLVVGGSPCQDLSQAGKRAGLAGKRSVLLREQIRIVAESKPRYHFWENVRGALTSNDGEDWRTFMRMLDDIGHMSTWLVLTANRIGATQHRARIFLLSWPTNGSPPDVARGAPPLSASEDEVVEWARWLATPGPISAFPTWHSVDGEWPQPVMFTQDEWEPPRLITERGPAWSDRLSALGDSWIPQQAAAAWHLLCRQASLDIESASYGKMERYMWPTPRESEYKGVGPLGSKSQEHMFKRRYLTAVVQQTEGRTGRLNPDWVEALSGWPVGWTIPR